MYWPEVRTPDYFISWGWSKVECGSSEIISGYNLIGRRLSSDFSDNIVIVMKGPGNRSSISCRHFEYLREIDLVKNLVCFISDVVGSSITVKMHHGSGVAEQEYLSNYFMRHGVKCVVDRSITNLQRLSKKFGLFVFTYDSAGLLEALSSNVPVVAIFEHWPDRFFAPAASAYRDLVDVGIFHRSLESFKEWLQKHEDNFVEWWFSDAVQKSRLAFANQYCRSFSHEEHNLPKLLKSFAVSG
jgi:putative transferase (TIGR04331 family)